eukprot:13748384-Alexandrium_andersonii.AAC.1
MRPRARDQPTPIQPCPNNRILIVRARCCPRQLVQSCVSPWVAGSANFIAMCFCLRVVAFVCCAGLSTFLATCLEGRLPASAATKQSISIQPALSLGFPHAAKRRANSATGENDKAQLRT